MASGAARRAARRANMASYAEADRLNNLRAMATRDPEREGEAFPLGRAKLRRGFAKRGTDTIGMHSTVGISDSHDGAMAGGCDDRRFYQHHRVSDLGRNRMSAQSVASLRFESELKASPMGRLGNGRD